MALPVREQLKYWGVALAIFLFLLWWLGDVILPFVLGAAVAYLLDPVADRFERLGLSRVASVAIMTIIGLFIFVALILLVIPTLITQAASLTERIAAIIEAAPENLARFQNWAQENYPGLMSRVPNAGDLEQTLTDVLTNLTAAIRERAGSLIETALASVSGVVNALILFVIVPVVAFYLLLDWDRMVARIDQLLPREHEPTIRRLARDMDNTLASFIRGQGTVCLILGIILLRRARACRSAIRAWSWGPLPVWSRSFPMWVRIVGGASGYRSGAVPILGGWGRQRHGSGRPSRWCAGIFVSGQFIEGNYPHAEAGWRHPSGLHPGLAAAGAVGLRGDLWVSSAC